MVRFFLGDLLLLRKDNGEGKIKRIVEREENTNVQKMGVWSMEWVYMTCTGYLNFKLNWLVLLFL